jgi:hypothetical protein
MLLKLRCNFYRKSGGGAIDCIVRNISETGAALEVVSPLKAWGLQIPYREL